jgi:hypothetical protein
MSFKMDNYLEEVNQIYKSWFHIICGFIASSFQTDITPGSHNVFILLK